MWVFSNEVDVRVTPLTEFEPGALAEVQDARGAPMGTAYVNPRSLIAARLVSRQRNRPLDGDLLRRRLGRALALRESLFPRPFYRLVYGEGDGLPGLIVDRFGDVLVAQVTTAGMERVSEQIVDALRETVRPAGILLRNDTSGRALEGLESYVRTAWGTVPDVLEIEENGVRFEAPVTGQKTGWFYDHRMNRARMAAYVRGRRVLDVFSYVGGWGVQAAAAGASEVVCVDASAPALEFVERSAALNGAADRVRTRRADAFDALMQLSADGERFGVVVLDPAGVHQAQEGRKGGRGGVPPRQRAGHGPAGAGRHPGERVVQLPHAARGAAGRHAARQPPPGARAAGAGRGAPGPGPSHPPRHPRDGVPQGVHRPRGVVPDVRVHRAGRLSKDGLTRRTRRTRRTD